MLDLSLAFLSGLILGTFIGGALGLYGYGQLATLLRARYANPAIRSITKTDGLAFKVREIIAGMDALNGAAVASYSAYPTNT